MALIWLRDGSSLNQDNDWARRWLKLDRFDRHLGCWAKDLKEGARASRDSTQVLTWGVGWMVTIYGGSVQCAEQDLGRDWGGGQSRLVWIARGWSLLYVWVYALIHEPFLSPHLWPLCRLFIDGDRIDAPNVKEHLLLDLSLEAEYRIQVLPYKSILSELKVLCTSLSPKEKVWVSDKASYAVSEAIPKVGSHTPTAAPCPVLASRSFVFEAEAGQADPQDWLLG